MSDKNSRESSRTTTETVDRRTYLKLAGMAGSGVGAGLGTGALSSEFTTPAQAASETVFEDFDYSSASAMNDHYYFEFGKSNVSLDTVSTKATSDASDSVLTISGGDAKMVSYDDDDGNDLTSYPQVGDTITCWIRGGNASENVNVIYGAVDGDGRDDHYYVKVNMRNSTVGMGVVDDGSATWLASATEDPSFSTNTWYKLEIKWTDGSPNTHDVTLYDQNGNSLASFTYDGSDSADPNFEGSGVGYSAYVSSSGETAYFDYATTTGGSTTTFEKSNVDDFEYADKNLDTYRFDRGKSEAEIVTDSESSGEQLQGPTYSGMQALKISATDATEMISLPGDGLSNYPEAGDNITCYIKANGGADNFNFSWGVQGHQDRYYVKVKPESDAMHLFKYKGGSGDVLASTTGLSMSQDSWYWLEVEWGTDGTHTVELYDLDGNVLAECTGTDSEWSSGGIGFDAYLNSGETVYFDKCAIVHEEDPYKGGWGTVAVPSYGECCPSATTEDGTWYDVDNFLFYLSYNGHFYNEKDDRIVHDFQVSGTFHTYEVEKPYTPDPTTDDLARNYKQHDTKVKATSSDAILTSANDKYTWAYGLGGTDWDNWKNDNNNYVGTVPSFDDFKAAAENQGVVDDAGKVNDGFLEGLWFASTVIIGQFDSRAAFALGVLDYLSGFATDPEPNCTYDEDEAAEDVELSEWYWCDPPVGLVHVSRSLRVAVPKGSGDATVTIKQLVGGEGAPEDHFLTENLCKWEITCPDEKKNAYGKVSTKYGDF